MNVKLETLRDISTLGNQIYVLHALNPTKIDCMDLEYGGLTKLFIRLGQVGPWSHNLSCYCVNSLSLGDESASWTWILGLGD